MPLPDKSPLLQRVSARTLVLERLRGWIEDGTLEPGEVVRDVAIAEKLGVSRTPVREALQALEQLGVVETEPGRRTRVTSVSLADAALIYPPLGALQGLAAELATPRATADDLAEMEQANERLLAAGADGDAVGAREADERFHGVLVRRLANPYVTSAVAPLELHSRRLNTTYFADRPLARASYAEHRRIVAAVRRGDGVRAHALTYRNFVHDVLEERP